MAGAPGFEPGIAGPKPAALPLGYAPPHPSIGTNPSVHPVVNQTAAPAEPARPLRDIASDVAALAYAPPHPSIGTNQSVQAVVNQTAALGYARPSGVLLRLARVVAVALGEEI